MVTRVFVEKRKGFDVEARHMMADLRQNLGLKAIEDLRILNRYDVSGLSGEEFEAAARTILSEPNVDNVYDENYKISSEYHVFATEFLPGQYDQRADSASQCVQLLTQGERPQVAYAKVIAVKGDLSEEEMDKIKNYIVNPVESRLASMEKPETLDMKIDVPADVKRVTGMISWSDEELRKYYGTMGFAMTFEDLAFCRDYFRDEEHRDPSVTELRVIDTYWSDHCRHTTFLTRLNNIEIEKGKLSGAIEKALGEYFAAREELYKGKDKPVSLMDMAVIGAKYLKKHGMVDDLDESDEINACSIEVPVTIDGKTEQWLVQFKNETHNHPTEIEPFGGAATCLGGAIRDPLSGRAYVYQAMRVTGSGDPTVPFKDTMKGKLPTRKITTGAAAGYSSYGNQIGLATGQVTELYDPGYVAKRMEIGAVIGASPKANVKRFEPKPGDIIVLLGGATGRDGCGGATGSSKAHTLESIEVCGAEVQKGNPPTERKIQRLFRDPEVSTLIKRCNDFGAGGVCVAIGELAPGLEIDLNKVPKKYEGLDGTELAISESQERMAVVLDPKDVEKFRAKAQEENLDAQVVAIVTEEPRLKMEWRGDRVVDLSRAFLDTNGVTQNADAFITAPDETKNYRNAVPACLENKSLDEAFAENLSRLEVCGQKGLSERFDASIGAGTVLMPFAGKYQLTPEDAMVAKIPLLTGETDDATAMAYGYIPGIARFSPFHGAAYAVVESLSKLAAVGADPMKSRLTFQEYFERLHDKPERWGKPAAALLGALTAQLNLGLPSIGGKDSMSGSFYDEEHGEIDVPPTLVSFAVDISDTKHVVSPEFKKAGSKIVLFTIEKDAHDLPVYSQIMDGYEKIYRDMESGKIISAYAVEGAGVAEAVSKMAFGNRLGVKIEHNVDPRDFFAAGWGNIVCEVPDGKVGELSIPYTVIGEVTDKGTFEYGSTVISMEEALKAWTGTLEKVFPTASGAPMKAAEETLYNTDKVYVCKHKVAKPTVFIPAMPGTNCELDSAKAFEAAGAETIVRVFRNQNASDIRSSIEQYKEDIKKSQIIMFPGGFSAGDEPDGSAKFFATVFRNEAMMEEIDKLLHDRDGLVLGICNGFQTLIKLGLLTGGKIEPQKADSPTLTTNNIGRHISRMAYLKVVSNLSPWLRKAELGGVYCNPMSHGEGRFVANEEWLAKLRANGQIAIQYSDPNGNLSVSEEWNPNGSYQCIEGITSPDGRILGKMGHNERCWSDTGMNIYGNQDMQLFASGVEYFK